MGTVTQLGYLGLEVRDPGAFQAFAADVLGMMPASAPPEAQGALRMDDYAQRIVLREGPADDLAFAGFETTGEAALEEIAERATRAGVNVSEGKSETAAARRVARLVHCQDPSGLPIELYFGPTMDCEPFVSPRGARFVTGDQGLGHVVVAARDPSESEHFYCDVLGLRLSDRIRRALSPDFTLQITFLHANARHHSVAFAGASMPKRLHHFMVELESMDEVGTTLDRCLDGGFEIAQGLGRHPNDRMFSFYARTPAEFLVEVGWGGVRVDDATWRVRTYEKTSTWGHRAPDRAGGRA